MGFGLANINVRFGADLREFSKQMQNAGRSLKKMGKQLERTGKNLSLRLTAPLAALAVVTTKLGLEFDTNMTKIQTLVGVSADKVEEFKKEVLSLAGSTAKAPQELSNALFTVTSAGLRGAEAMKVLGAAAKASAVGMGDTNEIARATTAVVQAYGVENVNAAKAADILTATVREGNLEASELAPVLGRVVGLAAQMGVSFEEVGASVATFTRLGVDSSEAITGLRGILNSLIKPTEGGAKALQSVGLTFEKLRAEVKQKGLAVTLIDLVKTFKGNEEALGKIIPNVRALSTVLGTAGVQADSYNSILKNLNNSQGILNDAFAQTSKGDSFKFKKALNDLKTVGTALGVVLLPLVVDVIQPLVAWLKKLSDQFQQLTPAGKKTIVIFAALAAALGPLSIGFGMLLTNMGAILKFLPKLFLLISANPLGALLTVLGLVAAAFLLLNGRLSSSARATKMWADISKSANESISAEKAKLTQLLSVAKDEQISKEKRLKAIQDLQNLSPDYLSNLSLETINTDEATTATNAYVDSLLKKAKVLAAEEKLVEIQKQLLDLQTGQSDAIKPNLWTTVGNSILSAGNSMVFASLQTKSLIKNLNGEGKVLSELQNKLLDFLKVNDEFIAKTGERASNTPTGGFSNLLEQTISLKPRKFNPKDFKDVLGGAPDLQLKGLRIPFEPSDLNLLGAVNTEFEKQRVLAAANNQEFDEYAVKTSILRSNIQQLIDAGYTPYSKSVANLTSALQQMDTEQQKSTGTMQNIQILTGVLQQGFSDFFNTLIEGGNNAFGGLLKAIGQLITKLLVAVAVASLLSLLLPSFGVSAADASFGKLFSGLSGFSIPGLANGGIVTSPTMALIGEGGESEAVIPLSKLDNMMQNNGNSGSSRLDVRGEFKFNGDDFITGFKVSNFKSERWRNGG